MKTFLTIKNLIVSVIIGVMVFIIVLSMGGFKSFSFKGIELDSSIYSFLPKDDDLNTTMKLTQNSSVADKLILYLSVNEPAELDKIIDKTDNLLSEKGFSFTKSVPDSDEILHVMNYMQNNSLLLYPYEKLENPFSETQVNKRLKNKSDNFEKDPFADVNEPFLNDPLNLYTDVVKLQFSGYSRFNVYKGGVLSADKKAFIRIYNTGFSTEDYAKSKELVKFDDMLKKEIKSSGTEAFLFSAHLFFQESNTSIQRDVTLIFILSIILTVGIFLFFFRNIVVMVYSFIPVLVGMAFTFLIIYIFKGKFGAIALGFGATTAGICIDYSIHYLSKLNLCKTRKEIRAKIGKSMLLGYLTTIASFLLLPLAGVRSLSEISFFGVLVITISFLAAYFLLQTLLRPEHDWVNVIKIEFPDFTKKVYVAIFSVIMLIFIAGAFFARIETNANSLDMDHKELNRRIALIKSGFSESTDNVFLTFYGKSEDEAVSNSVKGFLEVVGKDKSLAFMTPGLFIPPESLIKQRKEFVATNFNEKVFYNGLNSTIFDRSTFEGFVNKIRSNNIGNITDVPEYLSHEYRKSIIEDKGTFYVLLHISDRKISSKIDDILKSTDVKYKIFDVMKASESGLYRFGVLTFRIFIIAIVVILILLSIVQKSFIKGFFTILPAIMGLLASVGFTTITGNKINIMHFTSYILIFGIGVDYGVFMVGAHYHKFDKDHMNNTIQSILVCALTTLAGFGVLAISSSKALYSLGSSMLLGIVFAMLTSFIFIPAILKKLVK